MLIITKRRNQVKDSHTMWQPHHGEHALEYHSTLERSKTRHGGHTCNLGTSKTEVGGLPLDQVQSVLYSAFQDSLGYSMNPFSKKKEGERRRRRKNEIPIHTTSSNMDES